MIVNRVVLCALLAWPGAALAQALPPTDRPPTISLTGRATITVPPDNASVRVGVVIRAPTAAGAVAQNSTAVAALVKLAREIGVDPRSVATSALSLQRTFRPVRRPNGSDEQVPDGYEAQNIVTIRLSDMVKLGDLLQRAVEGGVNRIDGISFGLSAPGPVERQASVEAVRDAVERARVITEAAGVSLGPVQLIQTKEARVMHDGAASQFRFSGGTSDSAAPPVTVEAGLIAVSATVEITWRLRDP